MVIKILGTGCPSCKKLKKNVAEAVDKFGIDAKIEEVTDIQDIISYGVMGTPTMVVDEKVVSTGRVLSVEQIGELIK